MIYYFVVSAISNTIIHTYWWQRCVIKRNNIINVLVRVDLDTRILEVYTVKIVSSVAQRNKYIYIYIYSMCSIQCKDNCILTIIIMRKKTEYYIRKIHSRTAVLYNHDIVACDKKVVAIFIYSHFIIQLLVYSVRQLLKH